MERDCLKLYDIRILILSRGRSDTAGTPKLFPSWVEMLVPESEKDIYRARFDNPILTTPDDVCGMGALRNWVLDNFKENCVIMLDDDFVRFRALTGRLSRPVTDKDEAIQILINTAVMAMDAGVHVFGFNQKDVRAYNATTPFSFTSWVGGAVGVIGRKFRFRNDKFKVDIDYCMKCWLTDRIVWVDSRYTFDQHRDNNKGGNSIWRTQKEFDESTKSLCDTWGRFLKVSWSDSQISIRPQIKRRQSLDIGG